MKFPKLRWLPTISVLFLSGFHFLFSQVLSPPTLSSTHGNGPVISVCDSETIDPLAQRLGKQTYPDLGASFLLHNEKFFAGLALSHLNQPNISFDKESSQKLPIALAVQGGVELEINPYQYGFLPENSFLFLYNSVRFIQKSTLINLSQDLQLSNFSIGLKSKSKHSRWL